jgi:hypothetical protein
VQDLILGDKERNIGEAHAELYKTVRTLIKEDPMSLLKPFFDIERFETRTKKFVHFRTDGVSVSILLGEESEPKPRARKPKRKRGEEDELPALSSPSYEMRVGLDPGLCYLFIAKNNSNAKDKKLSAKMSSKEYYHESKFNWNKSKQNKCYARHSWWKEMINGNITSEAWKNIYKKHLWWKEEMVKEVMTPKTHVLDELKKYAVFALSYLDKALELHYKNPFRKWSFKTYIYKQKTFEKILQRITTKKSQGDNKKVIVGFGNWGYPRDSIIQGHHRGPVQEVKNKLQKWCEVVDVDEFHTSKLCCHCHCELATVKYNGKEINSVLRCSNNKCGITIDHDITCKEHLYVIREDDSERETP